MPLNIDMSGSPQEIADKIQQKRNALHEVDSNFGGKMDAAYDATVEACDLEDLLDELGIYSIEELMDEDIPKDKKMEILSIYIKNIEERL
jgi:hypothetical protein